MRLLSTIIAQLSLLAFLLVSVHPAQAQSQSTPATKDSTIMRSTVSCPDCPNHNCYECTLGHNNTLVANTGGLAYIRALIGFTLPYDGSLVRSCQIQIPAFTQPLQSDITVVFWQAVSSNWDESTVTANNAPDAGGQVASVTVPATNNMGPVDITGACRNATSGQFSVYIGTQFGRIEFWSKDSGNPAILHVDRFVKKTPS